MSFEAIGTIAQAEEDGKTLVLKTRDEAKAMAVRAHADGKTIVEDALKKAETELTALKIQAENTNNDKAAEYKYQVEKEKNRLKELAYSRMDEAASAVVERIVNG